MSTSLMIPAGPEREAYYARLRECQSHGEMLRLNDAIERFYLPLKFDPKRVN